MANCNNCGSPIIDGHRCEKCGYLSQTVASKKKEDKINKKLNPDVETEEDFKFQELSDNLHWMFKRFATEDFTSMYDIEERHNNKVMALFSYLGILIIIPFIAKKDEKYIKFHVKQGLNMLICWFICDLIIALLGGTFNATGTSIVFDIVTIVVNVIFVLISITGIINVLKEKAKALPLTGKIKIIKK